MRYAVAGHIISIGTAAIAEKSVPFVAADFNALTWTPINEWSTMGDFGDSAALIEEQIIGEGRDKAAKGTRNAGTMENVFNLDPLDPGQLALIAAEATNNNYPFKIEMTDKPAVGASPKNSLRYFIGMVTQAREMGGGANVNRKLNASIKINSNIVRVAASPT